MTWKSYGPLAWTEKILAPPEKYEKEVIQYITAINRNSIKELKTMLHLGCGAGGHDLHFRKHFELTGVDISEDMLKIAKELNPDVRYIHGDMRSIRLKQEFDVVIIPDSIMYMNTLEDLKDAIHTASLHLSPGGILLVVVHPREEFQNNNFVYTGTDRNTHITLFENNHVISETQYEATLVYLIRQNNELQVHFDVHTLGLFDHLTWVQLFAEASLSLRGSFDMDDLYDEFLPGEGKYKLKAYICTSPGQ